MTVIGHYFEAESYHWLIERIERLEGQAKYCAFNAIRYLRWADDTFPISPLVANFNASHATEEAVVSFISSAVLVSDVEGVKSIRLKEHKSKVNYPN